MVRSSMKQETNVDVIKKVKICSGRDIKELDVDVGACQYGGLQIEEGEEQSEEKVSMFRERGTCFSDVVTSKSKHVLE
jgi:hypothetical protein